MDNTTRFREWIVRAEHSIDTAHLHLEKFARPLKVAGKVTPPTMDDMTVGQMVQLTGLKDGRAMFYTVCEVLLGLDKRQVDEAFAVDVVRFVGWVYGRIQTINALFDRVKGSPTSEEVSAGISQLNFGVFGMIDWYARRMGIHDHEEVMSVTWVRLYKCLEMDHKKNEFDKRLAKEYARKYEHRK